MKIQSEHMKKKFYLAQKAERVCEANVQNK